MSVLVITRKVGDAFWLDEKVRIEVVDVDRGRVKISIEAPREVMIRREEVDPRDLSKLHPASSG